MAARNPSNRNPWIIAALAAFSAALLAWFVGAGGLRGAGAAKVSVAPTPDPAETPAGGT